VTTTPLVSVIVPTIRRPALVLRAVRSVLSQTWANLELIVLIDGPDPATVHVLASVVDRRLRVLQNPVSRGAGAARNQAAAVAMGAWLAFLDDDDEWLATKLALQMAAADPATLVSCRCQVRTPRGSYVWPRRLPHAGEAVDDYLYRRRSPWRGESYLATPTFLLPAAMFAACGGFGESAQNEDTTLLLRVTKRCGGRIVMLPDVLVVVHAGLPDSLGSSFAWRDSLRWLDSTADMITPHAYSGFCLITLASQAARDGDIAAIPVLLRQAWLGGSPTAMQMLLFATFWALPMGGRQRLRALWERLARRTRASACVRPPDTAC
jgi:glycosyltransferase involved in cell wall biosynthesis